MSSPFGWRAGFDMAASHVFPQGVLAAVTLLRGVAGDGGARAGAGREVDFPSVQWLSLPHRGGL